MAINCVFDTALPITPNVAALLYKTAQTMARKKKKKMKFEIGRCKGTLTTAWEQGHIGAVSGIRFEATIRMGRRTDTTVLVVRSFEDNVQWTDHPDIGDLNRHTIEGTIEERKHSPAKPH